MIVDNFLSNYDAVRDYCDKLQYGDIVSAVDSISYKNISMDVPVQLFCEVLTKLSLAIGRCYDQ